MPAESLNLMAQLSTFAVAGTCFASFLWGAKRLFVRPGGQSLGIWAVTFGTAVTIFLNLGAIAFSFSFDPFRLLAALLCFAGSLILYWTAVRAVRDTTISYAFSDDVPQTLIATGPFAQVRHPFYVAYLLAWLGGAVATGQWWLLVPCTVMAVLFDRAARFEEGKFLDSALGDEYRAYQEVTGRFLPRPEALSERARLPGREA